MGAIDLEVERLPVRLVLFAMPAPAVEEPVWPGGDPLLVAHIFQHSAVPASMHLQVPSPDDWRMAARLAPISSA
jgi:hypothetical protein